MITKQKKNLRKNQLPIVEWAFKEESNVPNDQLEACYYYEYGRELFKHSKPLNSIYLKWKAKTDLDANAKLLHFLRQVFPFFPAVTFDIFPKYPWQILPKDWPCLDGKTIDLRSAYSEEVKTNIFHRKSQTISALFMPFETFPPSCKSMHDFQNHIEFTRLEEKYFSVPARFPKEKTISGFFAIDMRCSDNQIINQLRRCLSYHRKHGFPPSQKCNRGGFRDRLNWLGAHRFLNHYSKPELRAKLASKSTSPTPYGALCDLRKAAIKCEELMNSIFPSNWKVSTYYSDAKSIQDLFSINSTES